MLVYGADVLVRGATKLALNLGISVFVVGLTVVAFGTSAPELCVSLAAALKGSADVAIGNVLGSNLFNVLVVIGLAGFINSFTISEEVLKREMPIMISVVGVFWALAATGSLTRVNGIIMFTMLVAYVLINYKLARSKVPDIDDDVLDTNNKDTNFKSILLVILGLVLMVFGSDFVVNSSIFIARKVGISELVIGMTLVAVGTSLPEIATTIVAAKKGEPELVVGNAIGSNIFNVLCVVGLTSVVKPLKVNPAALAFDFPFTFFACLAVLPLMYFKRSMSKFEGTIMLVAYGAYILLVLQRNS